MRHFLNDENGQAVVEYVLMLAVVVSVVSIMASSFRRILFQFWTQMSKEISAGCPKCIADPSIRSR
jgi:Flp pilus assembly pilin Flp